MESVNMMRAVLVATALLAAIVSAALGEPVVALVLLAGCAVHGAMWWYIRRRGTHPTVRHGGADVGPPASTPGAR